jgi:hypothetical protein
MIDSGFELGQGQLLHKFRAVKDDATVGGHGRDRPRKRFQANAQSAEKRLAQKQLRPRFRKFPLDSVVQAHMSVREVMWSTIQGLRLRVPISGWSTIQELRDEKGVSRY